MSVDVIMPQMGESIAEGTIVKWLKKVGDPVERDEPLFEISTDKVEAEIPSPGDGVLGEILVSEGTTVEINTVVGRIMAPGEKAGSAPKAAAPAPAAPAAPAPSATAAPPRPAAVAPPPPPQLAPARPPAAPVAASAAAPVAPEAPAGPETADDRRRRLSSPLVRRMAREQGVELSAVEGSGLSGRVTKRDLESYLEREPAAPARIAPAAAGTAQPAPSAVDPDLFFGAGQDVRIEPMTVMRRKIAEHMVQSRRTSAHVTTFFEVDMSNVSRLRDRLKGDFMSRDGVKLTYFPFFLFAVTKALRLHPHVNASITENWEIVYKRAINLGIAVALDWGLIVPVIKNAEEKNLLGLAKASNDLAERARSKRLLPDEVQGGTFSITNPGVFGSLAGTPIINQPQVAILGIGAVQKRVVVIDDAIAIRPMVYLSISYDHRLVDGAAADHFMIDVKKVLETSDFGAGR